MSSLEFPSSQLSLSQSRRLPVTSSSSSRSLSRSAPADASRELSDILSLPYFQSSAAYRAHLESLLPSHREDEFVSVLRLSLTGGVSESIQYTAARVILKAMATVKCRESTIREACDWLARVLGKFSPSSLAGSLSAVVKHSLNATENAGETLAVLGRGFAALRAYQSVPCPAVFSIRLESLTPAEFEREFLTECLAQRWAPRVLNNLLNALEEFEFEPEQWTQAVAKIFKTLAECRLGQLPELVHRLFILAKKQEKSPVLEGILQLFNHFDRRAEQPDSGIDFSQSQHAAPSSQLVSHSIGFSRSQLQQVESTVLMNFHFSFSQDPDLGQSFLSLLKEERLSLTPFTLAVLFSVSRIQRYERILVQLVRDAVVQRFQRLEIDSQSRWIANASQSQSQSQSHSQVHPSRSSAVRDVNRSPCAELCLSLATLLANTRAGWDQLLPPLVDLGFQLMETKEQGKSGKAGVVPSAYSPMDLFSFASFSHSPSQPHQNCVRLGCSLIRELFHSHDSLRSGILEQLLNRILTGGSAQFASISLLHALTRERSQPFLEHSAKLKAGLDYLSLLDPLIAQALIRAIEPLLSMRNELKDYTILVLRKALLSRENNGRLIAVKGLLAMIEFGAPQDARNDNAASSSSSSVSPLDLDLLSDVLSSLRRSLTQDRSIRDSLYSGLWPIFIKFDSARPFIFDLLLSQFLNYFDDSGESERPFDLKLGFDQQQRLIEPFPALLYTIGRAINACPVEIFQDDSAPEWNSARALRHRISQLISRLAAGRPDTFGLSGEFDESRLADSDPVKLQLAYTLHGVYQFALEYTVSSCGCPIDYDSFSTFDKLFQMFEFIEEILTKGKTKPKTKNQNQSSKGKNAKSAGKQSNGKGKKAANHQSAQEAGSESDDSDWAESSAARAEKKSSITAKQRSEWKLKLEYSINSSAIHLLLAASHGAIESQDPSVSELMAKNSSLQRFLLKSAAARIQEFESKSHDVNGPELADRCRLFIEQVATFVLKIFTKDVRALMDEEKKGKQSSLAALAMELLNSFAEFVFSHCGLQALESFIRIMLKGRDRAMREGGQNEPDTPAYCFHFFATRLSKYALALMEEKRWGEARETIKLMAALSKIIGNDTRTGSDEQRNGYLRDERAWIESLAEEQPVEDPALARVILNYLALLTNQHDEEGQLFRSIAKDFHALVGDISHDEPSSSQSAVIRFKIINEKTRHAVALEWWKILEATVDQAEIVASVAKGRANAQEEEDEATQEWALVRIHTLIAVIGRDILVAAVPSADTDPLVRLLTRIYKFLTAKLRSLVARKLQPSKVFQRLIKATNTHCTPQIHQFILFGQGKEDSQQENQNSKSKSKKKKAASEPSKIRIARESALFPTLIYQIESFESAVIRLAKLFDRLGLDASLQTTKARDFKINIAKMNTAQQANSQSQSQSQRNSVKRKQPAAEQRGAVKRERLDEAAQESASENSPALANRG